METNSSSKSRKERTCEWNSWELRFHIMNETENLEIEKKINANKHIRICLVWSAVDEIVVQQQQTQMKEIELVYVRECARAGEREH